MNFLNTFREKDGIKHIKQWHKNGVLLFALLEFFLLGKDRTSLELLKLSTANKIKHKLKKRYNFVLDEFDRNYTKKQHKTSNKIWICWFQGMENAPELVKKCYESVVVNNPDKKVVVITAENISEYVSFPDYIMDKWKQGIITHTHMTDLLRLELLINHGGMWLDATVFCTGKASDFFFNSDLFFFQSLKPGRDGKAKYISSWLMEAKSNNRILEATRELLYKYWQQNSYMCDYFLLHDFMSIVLDRYEDEWKKIIPRDNATPHILLLRLFDQYDEETWNAIKAQTPFHKLTYKFSEEEKEKTGTYYDYIFNNTERKR